MRNASASSRARILLPLQVTTSGMLVRDPDQNRVRPMWIGRGCICNFVNCNKDACNTSSHAEPQIILPIYALLKVSENVP